MLQKSKNWNKSNRKISEISLNTPSVSLLLLSACGGSNGNDPAVSSQDQNDFPVDYEGPSSDYRSPTTEDPYFAALRTPYVEPYWVAALEMDNADIHIDGMLQKYDRTIEYSFPREKPLYEQPGVVGWQPATIEMKAAARSIFENLSDVLNVTFVEVTDENDFNVIGIGKSQQNNTSAFAFFPNYFSEVGMDVFISSTFDSPQFVTGRLTNYDYEVLLHEIGHALGLKHPFAVDGNNTNLLNVFEDNTLNTVVSYDDNSTSFDGNFRNLDWMALTKFYGVNPSFNSGDDTYNFSKSGGTFIVDGSGNDTISVTGERSSVFIDLRPGSQSFLGVKSIYITDAGQLTISHGSVIENVYTGSGDDIIIGNSANNIFSSSVGDDTIFAGDGADVIRSGTGSDRIDLSEAVQAVDRVTVDASLFNLGFDTIYGFVQGAAGDVLDVSSIMETGADLFPLVAAGAAPVANFSGGVLRLVGDALATSSNLVSALGVGGALSPLSMSDGARSIIVSAASQNTGEDQSVFYAQGSSAGIQISQLALLHGNALDIDQWHAANFGLVA